MQIISSVNKIKNCLKDADDIGFVPTMGALHNGHISLIKEAKKNNKIVVVSIFVNPTQFLEGEDFKKYPRELEKDIKICKKEGVDFLFTPSINDIYFKDELNIIAPNIKGFILEGFKRAGHFNGVLQIVLKLFNIIKPTQAYFGKKDAQQLYLIKNMTKTLFLDINIIECDTVRENSGLALSSRNKYLNEADKKRAISISKALFEAKKMLLNGSDLNEVYNQMVEILDVDSIDYIEFTNKDFEKIYNFKENNTIILIAVIINGIRLIDNIFL